MNKFVLRQIFWRSLLIQCVLNFAKMQNTGFATAMMPVIRRLFPQGEEQKKALLRHFEHFNTQPCAANIIMGMIAAKEEEYASSGDNKILDDIHRLKEQTARAFAALGDAFFWGLWRPFVSLAGIVAVSLGIILGRQSLVISGIVGFLIMYNLPSLFVRWYGLRLGYAKREGMIDVIFKAKPVIQGAIWWIKVISLTILACFGVFLSSQTLEFLEGQNNLISYLSSGAIVFWVAITLRRISTSKIVMLIIIISVIQAYVF